MKAAPFVYNRADSLEHALSLLGEAGEEAMLIAGGQTLVPMMAMRFATPAALIDISRIEDLIGIEDNDTSVRIRACTRQNAALGSEIIRSKTPLLAKALPWVGHHQTRNRGTVGGSIAHGDPAAEIPLVATVLGAEVSLCRKSRKNGERTVPVTEFYDGPMMSVREADECLAGVTFPVWSGGRVGTGFQEISERHGDFGIVIAAAQVMVDEDGVCQKASLAIGGAGPFPMKAAAAEAILKGERLNKDLIEAAADSVDDAIDPAGDTHASADYRRRVAKILAARALYEAAEEAA